MIIMISNDSKKYLYGPIAGIVESIAMQPFDTLKVLKQSNQYSGLRHILYNNPLQLYKGLTPFTTQMFVKYFLRFTTFELFRSKNDSLIDNFKAGFCAGSVESFFITPFELVKTHLQTSNENKVLNLLKSMYRTSGIQGFYRGFTPTLFRQGINQGVNFSLYYYLRKNFMEENERPNIVKICLFSLTSSSIGPIITSPLDTIKTRLMNPKYNKSDSYSSILSSFNKIKNKEGYKAFYKGIEYRLFRVCGGQVITFIIIENLNFYF